MKQERIREIMTTLGQPDSQSLKLALEQVANEVAQECKQLPVPKEVFLLLIDNDVDKQFMEVTEEGVFYATKEDPFGEEIHSFEDAYFEYVSRRVFRDLKKRGYIKTKEQYRADSKIGEMFT